MDCLSPRAPVRKVVVMKAAQVGLTEAAINWLGFTIQHAPAPFLFVQPTVELAKRLSRHKLDAAIAATPVLRERVRPARSRDSGNTVLLKTFPGGVVVLTGANSAVGLRSLSCRYLCFDEVDAYPIDVEGEGDPIMLAEARAKTFPRRKILLISTPTLVGLSRIEREYAMTDQRQFFVPCPQCGQHQVLEYVRLRWEPGHPETVRNGCAACGAAIPDAAKGSMLAAGEWRATNGTAADPAVAGFALNALYAPWLPWRDVAAAAEAMQDDEAQQKTFHNTVLGLPRTSSRTMRQPGSDSENARAATRSDASPTTCCS
jgi:phage terminase large subunit GpA-like protein